MKQIEGIYAASLSILKEDLSLDIENTIKHAENLILYIFGSQAVSKNILNSAGQGRRPSGLSERRDRRRGDLRGAAEGFGSAKHCFGT